MSKWNHLQLLRIFAVYALLLGVAVFFQARLIFERLRLPNRRWSPKSDPFNTFALIFFFLMEFCLVAPVGWFLQNAVLGALAIAAIMTGLLGISSACAKLRISKREKLDT